MRHYSCTLNLTTFAPLAREPHRSSQDHRHGRGCLLPPQLPRPGHNRAMAERAVLVPAGKPVVYARLVEDMAAPQGPNLSSILDLVQTDYANG